MVGLLQEKTIVFGVFNGEAGSRDVTAAKFSNKIKTVKDISLRIYLMLMKQGFSTKHKQLNL